MNSPWFSLRSTRRSGIVAGCVSLRNLAGLTLAVSVLGGVLGRLILPLSAGEPNSENQEKESASKKTSTEVQSEKSPEKFDDSSLEFFESKVRPLLVSRCYECHSGTSKKIEGGLRLDSRTAAIKGGETGPAVVARDLKKSLLIGAINHGDLYQMPPKLKLPAEEIAVLTKWVELGVPWPEEKTESAADEKKKAELWEQRKSHWCWQAIQKVTPPVVKNTNWSNEAIDRFILAKLEEKELAPAPVAEKSIWLRRVTFDLIGLPPTAEDVKTFLKDESPLAYEQAVDRLLKSPHFGEHWARKWLDLVRFAETRGHEFDYPIANAWQYRDYCIRALNADVPYDQFVREHLAGDLLEKPRLHPEQKFNESVLGTGFWFLGEEVHSPVDIRQDETDRMDNRLDVMTKTFLGLTVGCARCHDHKFDPITQQDYYGLSGFLLGGSYRQVCFETEPHNRQIAVELDKLRGEARDVILSTWAKTYLPGVLQSTKYLLAAQGELENLKSETTSGEKEESRSKAKAELDAQRLEAWISELTVAKKEKSHPLHVFIAPGDRLKPKTMKDQASDKSDVVAKQLETPNTQIIVDYADKVSPDKQTWFTDGVAFGLHPVRPGDIFLSDRPEQPIAEFVTVASAHRDPAFFNLKPAPGNERDGNSMAAWDNAGQIERTPTVTLESGHVYHLVRGAGRCYASVDSHLVVHGPLHQKVLLEWNDKPGQWHWVHHDLSQYKGQRCHLEFSPRTADGMLEIARVVESENTPAIYLDDGTINYSDAKSVRNVLVSFGTQLAKSDFTFITNSPSASNSEGYANVVNWMIKHPALFIQQGSDEQKEAEKTIADVARLFIEKQNELIQQIRRTSHTAPAMFEGNAVDETVLRRGSPKTPGEVVPRRLLEMLGGTAKTGYGPGSGRLALAEQMLADDNPFVSRVIVNRVWHHLFGRGIVPTVDNFGILGQPPTHRELLDHLAERFRHEQQWSLKTLIRSVVLSQTYRMSSTPDVKAAESDPENLLWQHTLVRRVPAEAVRDGILAVSGRLDQTILGAPVEVHLTSFLDGRGRPGASGPLDGNGRRSIYTKVRRNFLSPMMLTFDAPIPFNTVGRRSSSNVPAQALILMNDPFVAEQSRIWAKQVLAQPGSDTERIERMYRAAFARSPFPEELSAALEFFQEQSKRYGGKETKPTAATQLDVWADYAQVLFNAKEFTFIR